MNKSKVGVFEIVGLFTTVMITKVFYTSVMVLIKQVGTAAWYATLVSCITSIVFFMFIYLLLKRFPGKEMTGVFEGVAGKIPGRALSLIFAAYLLYYAGMNLREFVEIIKAISLPYTATSIIVSGFVITIMFMAAKGLETIIRMSYIFFYVILGGLLLILILAFPYYNTEYITPIAGYGILNTLATGFMRSSAYDEIVFLAFIANSLNGLKALKKAGIICIIITGIVFSLCLLCILMAFGYTMASENVSDMYMLSRLIYFSRFFQRIEAVFIFIWVISSIVTVGTAFYFLLKIYSECFEIKNYKPLIYPYGILTFTVALLPRDLSEIIDVHMIILKGYSFLLLYGIPVLLLLISWIFKRKGAANNVQKI